MAHQKARVKASYRAASAELPEIQLPTWRHLCRADASIKWLRCLNLFSVEKHASYTSGVYFISLALQLKKPDLWNKDMAQALQNVLLIENNKDVKDKKEVSPCHIF